MGLRQRHADVRVREKLRAVFVDRPPPALDLRVLHAVRLVDGREPRLRITDDVHVPMWANRLAADRADRMLLERSKRLRQSISSKPIAGERLRRDRRHSIPRATTARADRKSVV